MPSTVEEVRCQDRRCRAGPAWESRRPRARMTRSGFSCHCTPKPTTRLEHVRPRRSGSPGCTSSSASTAATGAVCSAKVEFLIKLSTRFIETVFPPALPIYLLWVVGVRN